jgi:hypothetical protein
MTPNTLREDQAEMWATLTGPPEHLVEIAEWIGDDETLLKMFYRTAHTWDTINLYEVVRKFKIECIRFTMDLIKNKLPDPIPNYWPKVTAACQLGIDILNWLGGMDYISDATRAAENAAEYHRVVAKTSGERRAAVSARKLGAMVWYAATTSHLPECDDAINTAELTADAISFAFGNSEETYKLAINEVIQLFISIILSEHANKG